MTIRTLTLALAVLGLSATVSGAVTLDEAATSEFSDHYATPTDFSGYTGITAQSNGRTDAEYFSFDSLLPGTERLDFTLGNEGAGANMKIRLSSTPFTMAEWDWTITQVAHAELYANQWNPVAKFSWTRPDAFEGPLYGLAEFYQVNSPSTLAIDLVGARAQDTSAAHIAAPTETVAPVPVPGAALFLLSGVAALGAARKMLRRHG